MLEKIKKVIAVLSGFITLIPSIFGLSSVYVDYENAEKYDPSLGQIIVDTDMSVPRIFIIENGTSDYVIVKGANASPSEVNGAQTLQKYFKQISGVNLPIVNDTTPAKAKEIVIGKTNREGANTYTINRNKLGDDGLNIFVYNEKLIIAGGEQRGTLYGVYTFLEEVLGCRWFTAELTVVPESDVISARRSLYIEQIPTITSRDPFWRCAFDINYSVAQKINSGIKREISEENGGSITYAGRFVHTFNTLVPPQQYFEAHPEYYALTVNGKRETTQLCLTNPDVLRIITENAKQWLKNYPDASIISISQNDGLGYCVCEKCKAIDDAEQSHAGTVLRFVNTVAEEIEKEFPNVWVDTLAYDYTRNAPKITVPRENVVIRLCTIECCFSHPIDECPVPDKTGKRFSDDLKDWQKICDKIHIWDYTTNFSQYIAPYPNFHVLQSNVQFFAENNVKSIFEQGNNMLVNNGEFSHLKAYVLSKLLWDPYTDVEKHMNEFMRAFYGEGYQNIRKYIDFTTERAKLNHIECNNKPAEVLYLSSSDLKKCDEWWDAAEKAAKNKFELDNIQCSRLQVRYYKNYTRKGEFSLFKNNAETGEALYDDFMRFEISRARERQALRPKEEIDFNRRIDTWNVPRN